MEIRLKMVELLIFLSHAVDRPKFFNNFRKKQTNVLNWLVEKEVLLTDIAIQEHNVVKITRSEPKITAKRP